MNRREIVKSIALALEEWGALDKGNYAFQLDQLEDVERVVAGILEGYILVEGEVID